MAKELNKEEFLKKFKILPFSSSGVYPIIVREIARFQQSIDTDFEDKLFSLRIKMRSQIITPEKFWEEYKKALLKSVSKDKKTVTDILKKADKEMLLLFKHARKLPQEEKPKIDLRLPE